MTHRLLRPLQTFRPLVLALVLVLTFGLGLSAQDSPAIDCTAPLSIAQIQGVTDAPNCEGETVVVAGAVIVNIGIDGFFIQMPDSAADADPLTSEGIYVYTERPPVLWDIAVGDFIDVRGRVEEFFNLTQLDVPAEGRITKLATDQPLPEPIDLQGADLAYLPDGTHPLERYEGMRVRVTDAYVTAPTNQFDEFNITLDGSRSFREPGIEGDDFVDFVGIGLPEWDLNPEMIEVDPPEMGLPPVMEVTLGSRATVVGSLAYAFRDYSIWPETVEVAVAPYAPASVRPREGDEFIIATQNVENFFDTTDDPNRDDSRGENYTPADDAEYRARLVKLSEQVRVGLQAPDILALQEMENTRTMTDLILQIHADDPTLRYTGCLIEGNEGRGIDVAYLVRVDRVNLLDCYPIPGASDIIREQTIGYRFTRPPLVLEAELLLPDGSGFALTLLNLHNRSLSDAETDRTRAVRLGQAVHVAEWVQARQEANPDTRLIVLGDINGFEFSDGLVDVVGIIAGTSEPGSAFTEPPADIVEPDLRNRVLDVPPADRYSFIFNGSAQVLDHILTSQALDPFVTGVQFSRGNADAPRVWFTDAAQGRARSADHDGLALYLEPAG